MNLHQKIPRLERVNSGVAENADDLALRDVIGDFDIIPNMVSDVLVV